MSQINHSRTYAGNDSNCDILTNWTAQDLAGLADSDAAVVNAYCDARRAAWDDKLTCPADVADSDWADACGCQDLDLMPSATSLLLRGVNA